MPKQNQVVDENQTVEEVVKPKRTRTIIKGKRTGQEILTEIDTLKDEVSQLQSAIETLEPNTIIHDLALKTLNSKQKELEDSLNTVYSF